MIPAVMARSTSRNQKKNLRRAHFAAASICTRSIGSRSKCASIRRLASLRLRPSDCRNDLIASLILPSPSNVDGFERQFFDSGLGSHGMPSMHKPRRRARSR